MAGLVAPCLLPLDCGRLLHNRFRVLFNDGLTWAVHVKARKVGSAPQPRFPQSYRPGTDRGGRSAPSSPAHW